MVKLASPNPYTSKVQYTTGPFINKKGTFSNVTFRNAPGITQVTREPEPRPRFTGRMGVDVGAAVMHLDFSRARTPLHPAFDEAPLQGAPGTYQRQVLGRALGEAHAVLENYNAQLNKPSATLQKAMDRITPNKVGTDQAHNHVLTYFTNLGAIRAGLAAQLESLAQDDPLPTRAIQEVSGRLEQVDAAIVRSARVLGSCKDGHVFGLDTGKADSEKITNAVFEGESAVYNALKGQDWQGHLTGMANALMLDPLLNVIKKRLSPELRDAFATNLKDPASLMEILDPHSLEAMYEGIDNAGNQGTAEGMMSAIGNWLSLPEFIEQPQRGQPAPAEKPKADDSAKDLPPRLAEAARNGSPINYTNINLADLITSLNGNHDQDRYQQGIEVGELRATLRFVMNDLKETKARVDQLEKKNDVLQARFEEQQSRWSRTFTTETTESTDIRQDGTRYHTHDTRIMEFTDERNKVQPENDAPVVKAQDDVIPPLDLEHVDDLLVTRPPYENVTPIEDDRGSDVESLSDVRGLDDEDDRSIASHDLNQDEDASSLVRMRVHQFDTLSRQNENTDALDLRDASRIVRDEVVPLQDNDDNSSVVSQDSTLSGSRRIQDDQGQDDASRTDSTSRKIVDHNNVLDQYFDHLAEDPFRRSKYGRPERIVRAQETVTTQDGRVEAQVIQQQASRAALNFGAQVSVNDLSRFRAERNGGKLPPKGGPTLPEKKNYYEFLELAKVIRQREQNRENRVANDRLDIVGALKNIHSNEARQLSDVRAASGLSVPGRNQFGPTYKKEEAWAEQDSEQALSSHKDTLDASFDADRLNDPARSVPVQEWMDGQRDMMDHERAELLRFDGLANSEVEFTPSEEAFADNRIDQFKSLFASLTPPPESLSRGSSMDDLLEGELLPDPMDVGVPARVATASDRSVSQGMRGFQLDSRGSSIAGSDEDEVAPIPQRKTARREGLPIGDDGRINVRKAQEILMGTLKFRDPSRVAS